MKISPKTVLKLFNYWPPFLGSGITVKNFDLDKGYVTSQLVTSRWNANYFGTHFGGSLHSMCDPFFVMILAHKLGRNYVVWDLESNIKFKKAVKIPVTAYFEVTEETVREIIDKAKAGEPVTHSFQTNIIDAKKNLIAEVTKVIYVRLKK